MIKKIQKIYNVGSFIDYTWDNFCKNTITKKLPDGTPENKIEIVKMEKKNLFFGDNGNGKSTLVKILKSINGDVRPLQKNWNMENQEQEIVIETSEGENKYDGHNWTKFIREGGIKFFDKEFIKNNVGELHGEDENTASKNRGNHFFTLGAFKEKEEKLLELNNEKKSINEALWWVSGKSITDIDINKIRELSDEEVRKNKAIELKEKLKIDIEKNKLCATKKDNLNEIQKVFFPEIPFFDISSFDDECKIFEKKLSVFNFNYGEENPVKEIISLIQSNSLDECLVCGQNIKTSDEYINRIQQLIINYADENLEKEEKEMNIQISRVEKVLLRIKGFGEELSDFKEKYSEKINLIKAYGVDPNIFSILEKNFSLSAEEAKIIEDALKKITEKSQNKSTIIILDRDKLDPVVKKIADFIDIINDILKKNVTTLNNIKGQNLQTILDEIKLLDDTIAETETWLSVITNYERLSIFISNCESFYNNEKDDTEPEWKWESSLNDLRNIINKKFQSFILKYGKTIKKNIKELNSSISINFDDLECKFDGGISHGASRCGFELIYNGKNISRDLSDGEKRVIALSYFFTLQEEEIENHSTLESEIETINSELRDNSKTTEERILSNERKMVKMKEAEKIKNVTIVFDDPVNDFDSGYKQIVSRKIDKIGEFYEQIIVFTHDEKFYSYMDKCIPNKLSIQKIHTGSIIAPIKRNQIELYHNDLRDFYINGTAIGEYFTIREGAYKLRYCLEYWVKNDGLLANKSKFDDILNNIYTVRKWNKPEIEELKSIYSFCNNNGSHEGSAEGFNGLRKNIELYFTMREIELV